MTNRHHVEKPASGEASGQGPSRHAKACSIADKGTGGKWVHVFIRRQNPEASGANLDVGGNPQAIHGASVPMRGVDPL